MDLYEIIDELVAERARIVRIIESLESIEDVRKAPLSDAKERRGRKSMDGNARKEVSARMKRYWARRREQGGGAVG